MIKIICLISLLLVGDLVCFAQEISMPINYSIIDSASGDLDKDNIKEMVVAYNTGSDTDDENVNRGLIICKNIKH